ncbi:septal ring lytic transglycosylase RlpA family protein [Bordetella sp. BOR01]|uniref:septal ring lytic transglycosylase RlpA family protein n=1 Tax=Bordetella sp. BOR01 TaxID=2854779 RepID=UPI001C466FA0|nr:septal ring lytic transglycosylase RlpA family protein [Bordetella sp. BOR01]MBV7484503.1 septal ring lytic transglycosylase RlpA family protein [Bordetella sp. BOR01]
MNGGRLILAPILVGLAVLIAGCSSPGTRKAGGYYQDDGPGANPPSDLDNIPDAVPRLEPLASGANRPYTVFGKRYVPVVDDEQNYKQRGLASWYGRKFHGKRTSNGEVYDMYAMTAAHPTMPLPSYARVTSSINGRTVVVRVNDRGPFHSDRIMDLSYAAARKLGIIGPGSGEVTVERILPSEIRLTQSQSPAGDAPRAEAAQASADSTPLPAATNLAMTETELEPARAMTAAMPAEPADGVYLQMGAFSQPSNAQTLMHRVNGQLDSEAGMPPAVVQQTGSLYRVRIGPYSDRAAALGAARQVADRTGILPSLAAP